MQNVGFGFMHCLDEIGDLEDYDLSRLGDVLAKEHYLTLEKAASDCLQCGHCNSRCPFSVDQMARMEEIQAYFGKLHLPPRLPAAAVWVDAGHSRSRQRSVTDVGLPLAGTHCPGRMHRFLRNSAANS